MASNWHAPSVNQLAEIFSRRTALNTEASLEDIMSAAMEIPLVPVITVKSTSGVSKSGLDFERFAEHVYGTPKILGWWPDLMEDAAAALASAGDDVPSLTVASQLFETAAEGKS